MSLNFFLCQEFTPTISIFFNWKRRKQVEEVVNIMQTIQDFGFSRERILNIVLQNIRRLLDCEYYVLHFIDVQVLHEELRPPSTREPGRPMGVRESKEEVIPRGRNFISQTFVNNSSNTFKSELLESVDNTKICYVNLMALDNVYGYVAKTGNYFITENILHEQEAACRFPKGHPVIKSFFLVPFKSSNGTVFAMAGFANSSRKLSSSDYKLIKPILNWMNSLFSEWL